MRRKREQSKDLAHVSRATPTIADAQKRSSATTWAQVGFHADQRPEDPQHTADPMDRPDARDRLRDLRRAHPEDDLRGHPVSAVQNDRRDLSDTPDGGHGRVDEGLLLHHVHESAGRGTCHRPVRSVRDLARQEDTSPGEREQVQTLHRPIAVVHRVGGSCQSKSLFCLFLSTSYFLIFYLVFLAIYNFNKYIYSKRGVTIYENLYFLLIFFALNI